MLNVRTGLRVGSSGLMLSEVFCLSATLGARFAVWAFRWHPRFASGLLALPLCGAAPTCGLSATPGLFACVFAGIRALLACFRRCPCAGRHLLFFAAAKKSRQKKAAHTASPCVYPRAPNVPTLHTATYLFASVASASNRCLTRFNHPHRSQRQRMVCAAHVANGV